VADRPQGAILLSVAAQHRSAARKQYQDKPAQQRPQKNTTHKTRKTHNTHKNCVRSVRVSISRGVFRGFRHRCRGSKRLLATGRACHDFGTRNTRHRVGLANQPTKKDTSEHRNQSSPQPTGVARFERNGTDPTKPSHQAPTLSNCMIHREKARSRWIDGSRGMSKGFVGIFGCRWIWLGLAWLGLACSETKQCVFWPWEASKSRLLPRTPVLVFRICEATDHGQYTTSSSIAIGGGSVGSDAIAQRPGCLSRCRLLCKKQRLSNPDTGRRNTSGFDWQDCGSYQYYYCCSSHSSTSSKVLLPSSVGRLLYSSMYY